MLLMTKPYCSVLTWLHNETIDNASSMMESVFAHQNQQQMSQSMLTYVVQDEVDTDMDVDDGDHAIL